MLPTTEGITERSAMPPTETLELAGDAMAAFAAPSGSALRGDRVFTPEWCARDMVEHFKPAGRILEPFKGGGVFTTLLPQADWCEIEEGRDFFAWSEPVEWIISNPPYSKTRDCFRHGYRVAQNVVYLVPLRNVFSGHGFVVELHQTGGIAEIRCYGTGSKLGFPMGNAVGAIHWKRGYDGPTRFSFYGPNMRDQRQR
jgi:hypothetical protein